MLLLLKPCLWHPSDTPWCAGKKGPQLSGAQLKSRGWVLKKKAQMRAKGYTAIPIDTKVWREGSCVDAPAPLLCLPPAPVARQHALPLALLPCSQTHHQHTTPVHGTQAQDEADVMDGGLGALGLAALWFGL
jgi:hypothetical protein